MTTPQKTFIPAQMEVRLYWSPGGTNLVIEQDDPGDSNPGVVTVARENVHAFVKAINRVRSSAPAKKAAVRD